MMERIIKSVTGQITEAALKKMVAAHPEIVVIGFYKDTRAAGLYLHRRYPRYP
jgi:hypothetical protein